MGILPARRIKLTYDHYLLFPEDGNRHEIIEGEHYMSPAPETQHQRIIVKLARLMGNHLERSGQGEILVAPTDVVLSDTNVVQPDLIYVSKENARIITKANIRGVPDLIVEVLSPGSAKRDQSLKKDLYARAGVKEYWIVDPAKRAVDVFRLGKSGYSPPKRFTRRDTLRAVLVPGFSVSVGELFK
ncbi:MAG: Uma2 family endonuclease [Nitrospirae bacterium]|nr:Uma2 family endonuclease [Nitrospirota bacterium]